MRSISPLLSPVPVSVTAMRTPSSPALTRTVILPPRSVYLIALVSRLVSTWVMRVASMSSSIGSPLGTNCSSRPLRSHSGRTFSSVVSVHSFISVRSRMRRSLRLVTMEKVEQLVDHARERAGVAVDDLHALVFLGRELAVGVENVGAGDDRRQWRAQLVAERGEELVLQPHRFVELLVFLLELAGLECHALLEAGIRVAQRLLLLGEALVLSSSSWRPSRRLSAMPLKLSPRLCNSSPERSRARAV